MIGLVTASTLVENRPFNRHDFYIRRNSATGDQAWIAPPNPRARQSCLKAAPNLLELRRICNHPRGRQ